MEYGSLVAAAIGFAPAIALMLWTLQGYTYPRVEKPYFSDPTLFGMFAIGIVIGVALYAVSLFLAFEYVLLGFIIEEAVKLVILNLPRFQRRADTPFYGFGLGAGMASALAFGAVNRVVTNVGFDASSVLIMVLFAVQLALLQSANGTTIGIGVARGQPFVFFGQAVVVHLAYVLLLAPFNLIPDQGESILAYALFGVATVFLASYYYYLHKKLLPSYVKEALANLQRQKEKAEKKEGKARKIRRS